MIIICRLLDEAFSAVAICGRLRDSFYNVLGLLIISFDLAICMMSMGGRRNETDVAVISQMTMINGGPDIPSILSDQLQKEATSLILPCDSWVEMMRHE